MCPVHFFLSLNPRGFMSSGPKSSGPRDISSHGYCSLLLRLSHGDRPSLPRLLPEPPAIKTATPEPPAVKATMLEPPLLWPPCHSQVTAQVHQCSTVKGHHNSMIQVRQCSTAQVRQCSTPGSNHALWSWSTYAY